VQSLFRDTLGGCATGAIGRRVARHPHDFGRPAAVGGDAALPPFFPPTLHDEWLSTGSGVCWWPSASPPGWRPPPPRHRGSGSGVNGRHARRAAWQRAAVVGGPPQPVATLPRASLTGGVCDSVEAIGCGRWCRRQHAHPPTTGGRPRQPRRRRAFWPPGRHPQSRQRRWLCCW